MPRRSRPSSYSPPYRVWTGIVVDVVDFRRVPGAFLGFPDITALAAVVGGRLASSADGAVVVQGTEPIEETSHLLDLLHDPAQPDGFRPSNGTGRSPPARRSCSVAGLTAGWPGKPSRKAGHGRKPDAAAR